MLQAKLAVGSSPLMWDPVALADVVDDDGGSIRIGSRDLNERVRPSSPSRLALSVQHVQRTACICNARPLVFRPLQGMMPDLRPSQP